MGYYKSVDGIDLSVPEGLIYDDAAKEISALWACSMFFGWADCVVMVLCKKNQLGHV